MHVVLLSSEYPPFVYGGIGTFTETLAKQLSKLGVTTTVVTGYPCPSKLLRPGDGEYDGIEVVRFPYPNLPPRHTLFQLLNLQRIYDFARDTHPDIIHGQCGCTFPASIILKRLAPIVVTFHDSPAANRLVGIRALTRDGSFGDLWTYVIGYPAWSFTFRRELSDSTASVAVSRSLMSDILKEMGGGHKDKLRTIYNGIDLQRLDERYGSIGSNIEERTDTILFAGRLFWRKGILELIKMAVLFRERGLDFKFIVHGTGPMLGRVCEDITKLNLANIEMKGFTDNRELMESMRKSLFVVLPSSYEACPMIILESMCLGKIPIMFDLPYAREITQNGQFGILARNAEDAVSRVAAITNSCDIRELQKEIRDYARTRFDANKTAVQYVRLYEQLLMNDGLSELAQQQEFP